MNSNTDSIVNALQPRHLRQLNKLRTARKRGRMSHPAYKKAVREVHEEAGVESPVDILDPVIHDTPAYGATNWTAWLIAFAVIGGAVGWLASSGLILIGAIFCGFLGVGMAIGQATDLPVSAVVLGLWCTAALGLVGYLWVTEGFGVAAIMALVLGFVSPVLAWPLGLASVAIDARSGDLIDDDAVNEAQAAKQCQSCFAVVDPRATVCMHCRGSDLKDIA